MTTVDQIRKSAMKTDSSLKTEWLTTKEAAQFLKVSEQQMRNWSSNGFIVPHKLGKLNRYLVSELEDLLFKSKRRGY